jgi:hypothetical protein
MRVLDKQTAQFYNKLLRISSFLLELATLKVSLGSGACWDNPTEEATVGSRNPHGSLSRGVVPQFFRHSGQPRRPERTAAGLHARASKSPG